MSISVSGGHASGIVTAVVDDVPKAVVPPESERRSTEQEFSSMELFSEPEREVRALIMCIWCVVGAWLLPQRRVGQKLAVDRFVSAASTEHRYEQPGGL